MFELKMSESLTSFVVILVTFVLFVLALFTKGFTNDLLLEAGVFLVSVKIIMLSGKINKNTELLLKSFKELCERPDYPNQSKPGISDK
jgi:hypothetical protein